MKKQAKKHLSLNIECDYERGNVLVIILIVVALMGALAFTFTRNSGGGRPLLTEGQSKIAASQILKYAKSVENAVKQLQLVNQCSESEINFDAPGFSWHDNANAPSDKSCDVFATEGGGLSAPINGAISGKFSGTVAIEGIGTDASDLIYAREFGSDELALCNALNNALDITYSTNKPPSDRTTSGNTYSFRTPTYIFPAPTKPSKWVGEGDGCCESDAVIFAGEKSGCYTHGNTGKSYQFYHVLIAR